jgi:hypothetical protein
LETGIKTALQIRYPFQMQMLKGVLLLVLLLLASPKATGQEHNRQVEIIVIDSVVNRPAGSEDAQRLHHAGDTVIAYVDGNPTVQIIGPQTAYETFRDTVSFYCGGNFLFSKGRYHPDLYRYYDLKELTSQNISTRTGEPEIIAEFDWRESPSRYALNNIQLDHTDTIAIAGLAALRVQADLYDKHQQAIVGAINGYFTSNDLLPSLIFRDYRPDNFCPIWIEVRMDDQKKVLRLHQTEEYEQREFFEILKATFPFFDITSE